MRCPHCKFTLPVDVRTGVCPQCGESIVSAVDASLDQMVQAASAPNLATLFRRAKEAGVIVPGRDYGDRPA